MIRKNYKRITAIFTIVGFLLSCGLSPVFAKTSTDLNESEQIIKKHSIVINEPPKDWNPLTATDEELAYYNYPPRPKADDPDPQAYEQWKSVVEGGKWIYPKFKYGKPRKKSLEKSTSTFGSYTSMKNWSGVVSQTTYTRVVGWWTEAWASADTQHRPAYSGAWVGLGGFPPVENLIQAGTESSILSDGSGVYRAFWEICGTSQDTEGSIELPDFTHSPGDKFYTDISFTWDSYGIGTASFYIRDLTSGSVAAFDITDIMNWSGVTSSADWIVERPDSTKPLANFGSVPFQCKAGSTSGVYYIKDASTTTKYVKMIPDSGTLLAEPSKLDAYGKFTDYWRAYQ